jgi:phosphohistidine phosphatase
MLLYLLRHADAESSAASDELRGLSEKGLRQAGDVARFCEAREIAPDVILTSPLLRARQTAEIVAKQAGAELVIQPWLTSGMIPDEALAELRAFSKMKSVMLVGHEPDFSQLAARLLGLPSSERLRLRKASLTCIEIESLKGGTGALQFMLPVKFM